MNMHDKGTNESGGVVVTNLEKLCALRTTWEFHQIE